MRESPSPELIELLSNLGLATSRQLVAVRARVRRMAGSLPAFDSLWLDSLVQAKRITPFQAGEIKAGRGQQLACGPHVAMNRRPTLGYAEVLEDGDLLLTRSPIGEDLKETVTVKLSAIAACSATRTAGCFSALLDHGIDGDRLWTTWEFPDGTSAAGWMTENGRFPPLVVLEIARRMLVGLCELERHGEVHGDLHVRSLFINRRGDITIPFAGLREAIRPTETSTSFDLPPHCYETLAPERVVDAAPPNLGSDLFACGCVWWNLLTGRPAISGGNSAAKLQVAAEGKVPDVRRVAPDTPEVLAELIAACTSASPANRPRSFAEMARILGPPAERGDRAIARAMHKAERWVLPRPRPRITRSRVLQQIGEVGAVAACVLLVVTAWRWMGPTVVPNKPVAAVPIPQTAPAETIIPTPTAQSEIQQVAYEQPAAENTRSQSSEPLRLPTGRTVRLASLSPIAGQRICGEADERVLLALPTEGLMIDADDLRFENIDFLADDAAEASAAMLILRCPTATFSGCRFLGADGSDATPTAIRWQSSSVDDWLPTDECLKFDSCAFHRVNAAIEKLSHRAASIELTNLLQTRSNCLVRCSLASEVKPLKIEMDRCTLRETGPALQITSLASLESRLDRIRVAATDSVFQLDSRRALIEFPVEFDESHLSQFKWVGTGSLCALQSRLAAIVENDEQAEVVDDTKLEISGLARSALGFAGDDLDAAASSELRRWVAARRSQDPPGISAAE